MSACGEAQGAHYADIDGDGFADRSYTYTHPPTNACDAINDDANFLDAMPESQMLPFRATDSRLNSRRNRSRPRATALCTFDSPDPLPDYRRIRDQHSLLRNAD